MIFENEFGKLHCVEEDGVMWFCASDVYHILGLNRNAVLRIDEHEKRRGMFPVEGGHRPATGISEAGVYQMIFLSRSRIAKEFTRWVTHEVIPSIRKTGGYVLGQEDLAESDRKVLENQIKDLANAVESANAGKSKLQNWLLETDSHNAMLVDRVCEMAALLKEHGIDPLGPVERRKVKDEKPENPEDPLVLTKYGQVMRRSEYLESLGR